MARTTILIALVALTIGCVSSIHVKSGSSIPQYNDRVVSRRNLPKTAPNSTLNLRPIWGVLTQPTSPSLQSYGDQYVAASYVKFLEAGGARVVPILYDTPEDELKTQLSYLSGVIFPGGGADLQNTTLYKAGETIFTYITAANDNGVKYPLFGHCMGFELLNMIIAQDLSILTHCDAEDYTLPLENMLLDSPIWAGASPTVQAILANTALNVTMNNHQECVLTTSYSTNTRLQSFYDVVSTNTDRQGVEFVSSFAAKSYPIWGYQWHPEKNQFEWNPAEVIQHTPEAIEAMQYLQRFAVQQSRDNPNRFPSTKMEAEALIYNYSPIYSESFDPSFDQVYVFNSTTAHQRTARLYGRSA